jgi:hypothetical protein
MKTLTLVWGLTAAIAMNAAAAEPLVGTWTLTTQTIGGKQMDHDPLTLRIYPTGDALEFAFSTPVNGIHLVSMKFVGVHIGGKEGQVQNVQGNQIGTIKINKSANSEYREEIQGPNRPKAVGKMSISADNKTLTSESEAADGTSARAVQVFARQ